MKNVCFLIAAITLVASVMLVSSVHGLPKSPTNPKLVLSLYIYPLHATAPVRLDQKNILSYHWREIVIKEPGVDPCGFEWLKISKENFYDPVDSSRADVRVVLVSSLLTVAFDRDGKNGFVDGKPVIFKKHVTDWFVKFVEPMAL